MIKNITLSAEDNLIETARLRAAQEKRTLNDVFREWLLKYSGVHMRAKQLDAIWSELSSVNTGGKRFSREEAYTRD